MACCDESLAAASRTPKRAHDLEDHSDLSPRMAMSAHHVATEPFLHPGFSETPMSSDERAAAASICFTPSGSMTFISSRLPAPLVYTPSHGNDAAKITPYQAGTCLRTPAATSSSVAPADRGPAPCRLDFVHEESVSQSTSKQSGSMSCPSPPRSTNDGARSSDAQNGASSSSVTRPSTTNAVHAWSCKKRQMHLVASPARVRNLSSQYTHKEGATAFKRGMKSSRRSAHGKQVRHSKKQKPQELSPHKEDGQQCEVPGTAESSSVKGEPETHDDSKALTLTDVDSAGLALADVAEIRYKVVAPLNLNLNLKIGSEYTACELQQRCRNHVGKLERLRKFMEDRTKLVPQELPVQLSLTNLSASSRAIRDVKAVGKARRRKPVHAMAGKSDCKKLPTSPFPSASLDLDCCGAMNADSMTPAAISCHTQPEAEAAGKEETTAAPNQELENLELDRKVRQLVEQLSGDAMPSTSLESVHPDEEIDVEVHDRPKAPPKKRQKKITKLPDERTGDSLETVDEVRKSVHATAEPKPRTRASRKLATTVVAPGAAMSAHEEQKQGSKDPELATAVASGTSLLSRLVARHGSAFAGGVSSHIPEVKQPQRQHPLRLGSRRRVSSCPVQSTKRRRSTQA